MRLPSRSLLAAAFLFAPAAAGFSQTTGAASAGASRMEQAAPSSIESAPQPMGYESDLYCFGYLGEPSESFVAKVGSAENIAEQEDFVTGDLLYVDAGADRGLKVGDEYWLVTREQEVFQPVTGRSLGRFYEYRGRGVIQSIAGRSAILRVAEACTDIPVSGYLKGGHLTKTTYLKKFEPIPIPLARKSPPAVAGDPPSGKAKGRIVFTRDGVVALGQDATVIVDLGAAEGLQPGDFLTIFRYSTGRDYGIKPLGTYWVNVPPPPGVEIPRTYLGEIAVLEVGDRWAIGRITDSYRLIEVGDEVELK